MDPPISNLTRSRYLWAVCVAPQINARHILLVYEKYIYEAAAKCWHQATFDRECALRRMAHLTLSSTKFISIILRLYSIWATTAPTTTLPLPSEIHTGAISVGDWPFWLSCGSYGMEFHSFRANQMHHSLFHCNQPSKLCLVDFIRVITRS